MAHIRQQIRDAFQTALTGLMTTGLNVFSARTEPLEMDNLPALIIATPTDQKTSSSGAFPRTMQHVLSVEIQGYAQQISIANVLDTIGAEVETAIAGNIGIMALCKDVFLDETEISISGESAQPSGVVSLKYLAVYHYKENAPETAT